MARLTQEQLEELRAKFNGKLFHHNCGGRINIIQKASWNGPKTICGSCRTLVPRDDIVTFREDFKPFYDRPGHLKKAKKSGMEYRNWFHTPRGRR